MQKRQSGILMHVSSLHGDFSVGSFGREAREFVDFLHKGGFSVWQVLPFCVPDEHDSPYKSYSSLSVNPYFIDLPTLYDKGYITLSELEEAKQHSPYLAEFDRLKKERYDLLKKAATRMKRKPLDVMELECFFVEHQELLPVASFLAIKRKMGNIPWQEWKDTIADVDDMFCELFIIYEFFSQWLDLKAYANERNISIIGDIPIYVSEDSEDTYSNPEQFLLDSNGYPSEVAGVPPDYFSSEGQLWGNPLYNWRVMKDDGYSLWKKRINFMLTLFDGIRIDHFRGLCAYWSVPRDAKSAKEGMWKKGPGRSFINAIKEITGDKMIIAEDLGDITDDVIKLREYSGFPGMRVLQFAFLGDPETPHLPHNYDKNTVAYSGTHDNNTLLGYIWELDEQTRKKLFNYCGYFGNDFSNGQRAVIDTLLRSSANTVILPIQDALGFGSDTRMNTPGAAEGNWSYRITRQQLESLDPSEFMEKNKLFGRI